MLQDKVVLFVCPEYHRAVGNVDVKGSVRIKWETSLCAKKCKSNICNPAVLSKA